MSSLPVSFNLRHPSILKFVNSKDRKTGDSITINATSEILDQGLVQASSVNLPGELASFIVTTCVRRQFAIIKDNQGIGDRFLFLPLHTRLGLQARAILGISPKMPTEAADFVKNSFNGFTAAQGAVDAYIKAKVSEFNGKGSYQLKPEDFAIFFEITCIWIKSHLDLTEEDSLQDKFLRNASTHLPDLFAEGKNFGDLGFSLRPIGDVFLDGPPSYKPMGSEVEAPKQTIGNRSAEEQVVGNKVREIAQKTDCEVSEPHLKVRITSIKREFDSKFEPGIIYIEFPCGGGMHVPTLIWFTRDKESVLYATCTYPQIRDTLKELFLRCLNDAIKLSAIAAFIEGDLNAGIESFKSHFWNLIRDRWGETIPCLIPDIISVDETGEWKQAGGFNV